MAYPYSNQYASGTPVESYHSTPSTPREVVGFGGNPQWESIEQEQQQQQDMALGLQQEAQQEFVDLHSPVGLPGSFPQTIQLGEAPPVVQTPTHDDSPVHLHPVQQQQQEPSLENQMKQPGPSIIRNTRRTHQQTQNQTHPYRRPGSAAPSGRQQNHPQVTVFQVQPQHVHFAPPPPQVSRRSSSGIVASGIPSTSSARHSPLVPSPSSKMMGSFASSANNSPVGTHPPTLLQTSPGTMDPPPLPPSAATAPAITPATNSTSSAATTAKGRYLIRMDTHYDPDTHLLTAVLEVPGVRREHLSVRLSTCAYNRVRQITVSGVVHPPFKPTATQGVPLESVSVRERKYGFCQRVIPVPAELKREDIEAQLQDGVLCLRFPCGAPGEEDGEDVLVR